MKYTILLEPEANTDIQEAIDWYNAQRSSLGGQFYNDLQKSINSLTTFPFHQVRYGQIIRCLPLNKFPFMIHFSVDEQNYIVIIRAVFNTSKNPKDWTKRI